MDGSVIRQFRQYALACNTCLCFLGPTRVHNPDGISIGSAVFAGFTIVTDRQTTLKSRCFRVDERWCVVAVTVFKCSSMGPDCSTCQSLQVSPHSSKYRCQWCGARCQHNSTCDRARLSADDKCPLPVIESVPHSTTTSSYCTVRRLY